MGRLFAIESHRYRPAVAEPAVDDVEHADGGALAAGPRGRGHGHEWQERLARGTALPDRRVDVVHQLAVVREQERDGLGGVDAAAAADRQDGVDGAGVAGEGDRVLETAVGRLDPGAVEDDDVEAVGGQAVGDLGRSTGRGDAGVGDEQDAAGAELGEVVPELVPGADAELQARGAVGEDGLGVVGGEAGHAAPVSSVPDVSRTTTVACYWQ